MPTQEWVLKHRAGSMQVVHYLDYFFILCKTGHHPMLTPYECLSGAHSGAWYSFGGRKNRRSMPRTFLGIELDTVRQSNQLSENKIMDLTQCLKAMLAQHKVILREMQVLVGHLKFACKVVAPGRAFLQRFCDTMKDLNKPYHRHWISAGMRQDLLVWLSFLEGFNGVLFWRVELRLGANFLQTCIRIPGVWHIFLRLVVCREFAIELASRGITKDLKFSQLFPIVGVVWLWAESWANSVVTFWCDN